MDIAALSMQMSQSNVHMQKDIAVMKLAMQTSDEMMEAMVNELIVEGAPVDMSTTGHVDVSV